MAMVLSLFVFISLFLGAESVQMSPSSDIVDKALHDIDDSSFSALDREALRVIAAAQMENPLDDLESLAEELKRKAQLATGRLRQVFLRASELVRNTASKVTDGVRNAFSRSGRNSEGRSAAAAAAAAESELDHNESSDDEDAASMEYADEDTGADEHASADRDADETVAASNAKSDADKSSADDATKETVVSKGKSATEAAGATQRSEAPAASKSGERVSPDDVVFWKLCDAPLRANLGGFGPDQGPPELRFKGVTEYEGQKVDLVVSNTTIFATNDRTRNGKKECFGRINVRHNSKVQMKFSFVLSGTYTAVTLRSFFITLYDLEESYDGSVIQSAVVDSAKDFYLLPDTSVEIGAIDLGNTKGVQFNGTAPGNGSDNPQTLSTMDDSHFRKGVSFKFENTSVALLLLQVYGGDRGRNFFFEGQIDTLYKRATTTTITTTTTIAATTTMVSTTSTTTTPAVKSTAPECTDDSCVIWGDPHVLTFDVQHQRKAKHPAKEAFLRTREWKKDEVSVRTTGTFWLVRSRRIHIQGTYEHIPGQPNATSLSVLALGGPFLGNNTLVIRPLSGKSTWNGQEILPPAQFPAAFVNDVASLFYHSDAEIVKDGTRGRGIDINLPNGVVLTVNRWKYALAAKITMCSQNALGGQSGQCGNYNGDAADDIPKQQVDHGHKKEDTARTAAHEVLLLQEKKH
eukprot:TRINITY_DN1330_c0_g1_i1.p1 TRINITY_DN1330_c0_g1~~TRINITY_DN1330_c0_g1_i1.p1  ORF type:complete len:692 (-),score=119.53 TRINITY_DN1330_c0_g1_i1:148-2223(-)